MVKTLFDNIYEGYAYSYPHKHSYRRLNNLQLQTLWQEEKKDALFLYVHLPFCEMRCGFCNLFTIANPQNNMVDAYLQTLEREALAINNLVAPQSFGQLAVGGGTPSFLQPHQLEKLFAIIRKLGGKPEHMPSSFEVSPATVTREKLGLLNEQGIDRVSMGVQSFLEPEVKALGRPQKNNEVYAALDLLKQYSFSTINLDLIYGAYGQTLSSWLHSVQEVIRYEAEEVFMYPLYVRPLTGITKLNQGPEDNRFIFYREAKQMLLAAGYHQVSMRMFRKANTPHKQAVRSYSCQEDGMIGLGAGARSYTHTVHYSSEYAVARQNIRSIIEKYIAKTHFNEVDYGIELNKEEQQRRFVIKSVLHGTGLNVNRYQTLYGHDALLKYPLLQELIKAGMASLKNGIMRLTESGLDYSDAIGPALYSEDIKQLITEFELQ
ncbi:STM4012 family radical SAM protein [Niastella sp. OAS944]|uniref:STM4012 family radical SAM protein n=1 Tax=Niastella sp. OAS944 TaxID=2664089 RepID=UPI00346FABBB|nr:oxygen-independent coproporphyrinogen-3 oxidase [Chitinophagaceae bacterium OAS944]